MIFTIRHKYVELNDSFIAQHLLKRSCITLNIRGLLLRDVIASLVLDH